jgi:hypothetical protein
MTDLMSLYSPNSLTLSPQNEYRQGVLTKERNADSLLRIGVYHTFNLFSHIVV